MFSFAVFQPKLLEAVDDMLRLDIAALMKRIPQEEKENFSEGPAVRGGAFDTMEESPFDTGYGEGIDKGRDTGRWIVEDKKAEYMEIFHRLGPIDGKVNKLMIY